jgi:hypothetical protein
MKMEQTRARVEIGAALLVFGWASAIGAQTPTGFHARILSSSSGPVAAENRAYGEIVREIDDPHTGARWLLVRDEQHPGGPGRLVLAGSYRNERNGTFQQVAEEEAKLAPVIRPGDRLVVEEHTALVDALLEARALGPAAPGVEFNARLTMGGRVVRVVALGPGHAVLRPETGAER